MIPSGIQIPNQVLAAERVAPGMFLVRDAYKGKFAYFRKLAGGGVGGATRSVAISEQAAEPRVERPRSKKND